MQILKYTSHTPQLFVGFKLHSLFSWTMNNLYTYSATIADLSYRQIKNNQSHTHS